MHLPVDPEPRPPPSMALTICTALRRSQSAKMMRGDFPPSSRETFFTLLRAQLKGTESWLAGSPEPGTQGGGGRARGGMRAAPEHASLKRTAQGPGWGEPRVTQAAPSPVTLPSSPASPSSLPPS